MVPSLCCGAAAAAAAAALSKAIVVEEEDSQNNRIREKKVVGWRMIHIQKLANVTVNGAVDLNLEDSTQKEQTKQSPFHHRCFQSFQASHVAVGEDGCSRPPQSMERSSADASWWWMDASPNDQSVSYR
jgi:hypothetical protein